LIKIDGTERFATALEAEPRRVTDTFLTVLFANTLGTTLLPE